VAHRPNILFFFTDDQRFDTIGALGHPQIQTPHLDDLVERGTLCSDAYIMGGSCPAVCMPSRAMLMTGRTLYRLQDMGARIPDGHALLGQTLREAGYRTFGTGKWHSGPRAYARSFSEGAEIFFGGMGDHWNVPACDFDPTGDYDTKIHQTVDFHTQAVREWTADHIRAGVHSTELFADATIDFLRHQHAGDRPFFSYVSFMAPHDPRTMPDKFLHLYPADEIELPANFMSEHPFDNGELTIRDEVLAAHPRSEAETREHLAAYYAMISHVDHHIGRVLTALDEEGLRDDTIIVFAGDNGLAVGQHGLFGKQSVYDHSVHVPLIFAGPNIPQGQQRDALTGLIDIFPTLCDLANVETPDSVEGCSLSPVFEDEEESVREYFHFAYRHLMRGVRDEAGLKLIETAVDGARHTQLFDLAEDPLETRDLSDVGEHVDNLASLREALQAGWCDEYGDTDGEQGQHFWEAMEWAQ
jgi:arylsulfatase A-like enzyme